MHPAAAAATLPCVPDIETSGFGRASNDACALQRVLGRVGLPSPGIR